MVLEKWCSRNGAREMVLGEPGDRVAELVSEPRLLRDFGKNFRGWRIHRAGTEQHIDIA